MIQPLYGCNEEALISSSLHYKECMLRHVAQLTLYIIQPHNVIGLTRLRMIYVC